MKGREGLIGRVLEKLVAIFSPNTRSRAEAAKKPPDHSVPTCLPEQKAYVWEAFGG